MTAKTSGERKRKLGAMLKADAEATSQRMNNKALNQYNENTELILKEVTEGGANQGTKKKINTLMKENANIARLMATRQQAEMLKIAIMRKENLEVEHQMSWQTIEEPKERSDLLSHTIHDLQERQEQLEKEIEETTALIMAPIQQQTREGNLQSDLRNTTSNVVSLAGEI